jgi:hypothetical protein
MNSYPWNCIKMSVLYNDIDRHIYSPKLRSYDDIPSFLDMLAKATVVDDAIRFVSQKSKEKIKSSSSNEDEKEESNEHDYDEDEDRLEEKQEEENGEVNQITINQVF